jgi:type II secretory ATPase GspE/PulE/Tfp pilus assembly ATPase PilB-like protein
MIVERKSSQAIREAAKAQGLKTLQRCGWQHCISGNTSLAEVMRFAEEVRDDAPQDAHTV